MFVIPMRVLLRLSVLLLLMIGNGLAFAANRPETVKSVLVLSPDMGQTTYLQEFYTALNTQLKSESTDTEKVVLFHENLDLALFPQETHRDSLVRWLKEKYRNQRFDAIVVVGHTALKFLLTYNKALWPTVPVVFTLANDIDVVHMVLPPNVNGKVLRNNFSHVVAATKTLFPNSTHLVLVGEVPFSALNKTFLPSQLGRTSDGLIVQDLRGRPLEQIKHELSNLSPESVIYFGTLTDDLAIGRSYGQELMAVLARSAMSPMLVDDSRLLGSGPLAALSFNYQELGKEAAEQVWKVMKGERRSEVELQSAGYAPLLDHYQVTRWQIKSADFPSGSEERFFTPSTWQTYRWEIIAAASFMVLLIIWVLYLIIDKKLSALALSASRQVLGQITQMNRKMTASIYNEAIGHELVQPLAAILSNVEAAQIFLKRDPPPLDLVYETLANIRRDNLRADALIKNMQGLLTKSDNELGPVDINWLVRKVLNFLSVEAKVRRIHIDLDLAADGMIVSMNIVQMQQVMVNLLLNSMDAIDRRKGKERRITIETIRYGVDNVRVSIVDTGTGFDEGVERVFDSFFTTKPEGVGLGLWITASIVQAHGGHIWAENRIGGGIMRFKLPLARSEDQ